MILFIVAGCIVHHANVGYTTQPGEPDSDALGLGYHLEALGVSGPSFHAKFATASNQISMGWGLNTASMISTECAICDRFLPRLGVNFVDYSYDSGLTTWGGGSPYVILKLPTPLCQRKNSNYQCVDIFTEAEYLVRFSEDNRLFWTAGISFEMLRMPRLEK